MALQNVANDRRVPWEQYNVQNEHAVNFLSNTGALTVSNEMLNVMLSYHRYRMFRYLENKTFKIGYGYTDPDTESGPTESEAYTHWRKAMFEKQRKLINQLPLISMTQSQFDGLLSLYADTGSWRFIQTQNGKYDLEAAIKANKWTLVADMIANGANNRDRRLAEARVIVLGDYNTSSDRVKLLRESISHTVTFYKRDLLDSVQKRQAELAYYRETDAFLPGLTNSQKKVILRLAPRQSTQSCDCD